MSNLHNVGVLVVVGLLAAIIVVSFVNGPEDGSGEGLERQASADDRREEPTGLERSRRVDDAHEAARERTDRTDDRFVPIGREPGAAGAPATPEDPGRRGRPVGSRPGEQGRDREAESPVAAVEHVDPVPERPTPSSGKPADEPAPSRFPRKVELAPKDRIWNVAVREYGPRLGPLMVSRILEASGIEDARRVAEGRELTLPAPDPKLHARTAPRSRDEPPKTGSGARPRPSAPLPFVPNAASFEQEEEAAGSGVYVVRKGDSLGTIAQRLLGSAQRAGEIARLNGIEDPDKIREGMRLKLPSGGSGN